MDCAAEERLVRLALDGQPAVHGVDVIPDLVIGVAIGVLVLNGAQAHYFDHRGTPLGSVLKGRPMARP